VTLLLLLLLFDTANWLLGRRSTNVALDCCWQLSHKRTYRDC